LIDLVRSPQVDPNFLEMTARDASELRVKLRGVQGVRLRDRQLAITQHLNSARSSAAEAIASGDLKEGKRLAEMVATLEDKWRASQLLMDVWSGAVGEERQLEYFEASRAAWTVHLPGTFAKLEVKMTGPYALGDDPSIADCYVIAWLARIVAMCGGGPVPTALTLVQPYMGGVRFGTRIQIYWGHWVQRSSFRRLAPVLFPS
jgi:glutathione S-transferase